MDKLGELPHQELSGITTYYTQSFRIIFFSILIYQALQRSKYLPTVLTKDEVFLIIKQLSGVHQLLEVVLKVFGCDFNHIFIPLNPPLERGETK